MKYIITTNFVNFCVDLWKDANNGGKNIGFNLEGPMLAEKPSEPVVPVPMC